MSNVLPGKALRAVWSTFRDRLILVGALVFFGVAVLSGLALLPAYAVLHVEKSSLLPAAPARASHAGGSGTAQAGEQQDIFPSATSDLGPQSRAERDDIIRSQAFLARITPFISATSSTTKILNTALALRPNGVRINNISVTAENGRKITITGEAPGREETNQYREALSRDGSFSSVSIPVGALVGVEGGKFTITLTSAY